MRIGVMINFTRAFDSAWKRMEVILFKPFNLGKWFTIGFSAFLAGLLAGGNGFNGSYSPSNSSQTWTSTYSNPMNQLNSKVTGVFSSLQAGESFLFIGLVVVLVFGFMLLIYWLGARGQFLLLDNVVRNRGAVAWPWRNYARLGNSLFFFYLLYLLATIAILIPVTLVGVFAALPLIRAHRWPAGGEIAVFAVIALICAAILIVMGVGLFLFRELGVPLMFRHGLTARPAAAKTWQLVCAHPGSMALFVLLRIALFIAMAVVAVIACCVTCCVGLIPYLGTVILLPAILFIKCFTLDFLAQFGPEYDVWTTDVPPPPVAPVTVV